MYLRSTAWIRAQRLTDNRAFMVFTQMTKWANNARRSMTSKVGTRWCHMVFYAVHRRRIPSRAPW